MRLSLANKNILITGSSRGIGFAIAEKFHKYGCNVILNGRNDTDLKNAQLLLKGSHSFCSDFGNYDETLLKTSNLMERYKEIDVLVCNIGNGRSVIPGEEKYNDWQKTFSSNLWPTTNAIEIFKEYIKKDTGSIICISSICGLETIKGAPITYSVAKAALNAYVKGMSRPLGKKGIRINAIAPGNILFEGSTWQDKLKNNPIEVKSMIKENVSLNCFGDTDDIANLVLYLASPLSKFITGAIFTADGGQIH